MYSIGNERDYLNRIFETMCQMDRTQYGVISEETKIDLNKEAHQKVALQAMEFFKAIFSETVSDMTDTAFEFHYDFWGNEVYDAFCDGLKPLSLQEEVVRGVEDRVSIEESDMDRSQKKNLDRFRGDLGESVVAYELLKRDWTVLNNLGGRGYDLLAKKGSVGRDIEVKTTDPALKTGSARNQLTIVLTDAERETSDFCIFYIHGYNAFYVIPKRAYPTGDSGSITVRVAKDGTLSGGQYEQYRDNWELLE